MTTIITVTESDTTPVRFRCFIKTGHDKTFETDLETSEPGGAAAYAMQVSLEIDGPYLIVGPKDVLDFIPEKFWGHK
jgi:hypothetical protein